MWADDSVRIGLALAGRAITEPGGRRKQGHTRRDHARHAPRLRSAAALGVSNGSLTCGGDYNDLDTSPTISIPVLCSDGRKGIIIATRDNNGMSDSGHSPLVMV